jgi:CRISPR-associated endonuclease/helicase Cas3
MNDELKSSNFRTFFQELHGDGPFPWQERLAKQVCSGDWPEALDLPTATGKTACLDVAVFAMAVRRRGPRRIFFVVDRRVVVDAAFKRMQEIAEKLRVAEGGVLKVVASRLREMAQDECPLDTYQMRGGIYRDDSWVRSPLQPTLIASTVDQTGSRLLFRGYGVGENTLAIHASLVANDSLILLDEAHCSRPFSETIRAVSGYREWAGTNVETPFAFVEMTATPGRESAQTFRLEPDDLQNPELHKRLYASKPAKVMVSKARIKDFSKLATELADEAVRLSKEPGLRRIAVMVNRVKTARLVYEDLQKKRGLPAHLLIGRMRPVDRSPLPEEIQGMLSGKPRKPNGGPTFVVATQCLEVGADLDFDAIVTECASIDALVQRFGRLDRVGDLRASGVTARGRVVIASPMTDEKYNDPIYGDALTKTWRWLKTAGGELDFGICSEGGDTTVRERLMLAGESAAGMRREASHAPVLLPAHLDMLAQTSPRPALEPNVHLFLHGKEDRGSPEVQVVWRADLNGAPLDQWAEIVGLCPPVSAEAMPVTLRDFRAWMTGSGAEGEASSDVEGGDDEFDVTEDAARVRALRWFGNESTQASQPWDIRPGDTLILAAEEGGWDDLGHRPPSRQEDVAELARWQMRRRGWVVRLHPKLVESWPENDAKAELLQPVADGESDEDCLIGRLKAYGAQLNVDAPEWLREALTRIPKGVKASAYPGDRGWILSQRFVEADSGGDESSAGKPVWLDRHLGDVTRKLQETAASLIQKDGVRASLWRAARLHDCGKADPRFQAFLLGGDSLAAQLAPKLLAKGDGAKQSRTERRAQRQRSELPGNFRHELVSLLLAAQDAEVAEDDLALHLIASHHGRCRPFAPVVEDEGADLSFNGWHLSAQQRTEQAAHRLGSGVGDRFWKLTRSYGWWGLAYLESILRLADWKASKEEEA